VRDLLQVAERLGCEVSPESLVGYSKEEQVIWLVAYLESYTRSMKNV